MQQYTDSLFSSWQIYEVLDQTLACWYPFALVETEDTTQINLYLMSIYKKMVADRLTKALITAKHNVFVEMTGIENQKDLLASIKKKENLWNTLQQPQTDPEYSEVYEFEANVT